MVEPAPEGKAVRRRRRDSYAWLSAVPLLTIPLVAYAAFALAGTDFDASQFPIRLPSQGIWHVTIGAIIVAVALLLLFFEILKATRTGGHSVVDHALSMIVFVACLILFLIWDRAASSTFFLVMLMALIDVIAGFTVTIVAARRDYSVAHANSPSRTPRLLPRVQSGPSAAA